MSKAEKSIIQIHFEEEIERTLAVMKTVRHETKEYAVMLDSVERLYRMLERETRTPEPVSRNTMAVIGANLAGIMLILKHEYANVITSKALSFVIKPKL